MDNGRAALPEGPPRKLLRFPPLLLAQSLPRKRFFGPALFTGLHVETMLLDLLDDVFLLHFAFETPQRIFQRFILLDDDFRHCMNSPPIRFGLENLRRLFFRLCWCKPAGTAPVLNYCMNWPLFSRTLKGRWLLLNQFARSRQGIFAEFLQFYRYYDSQG